MKMATARYDVVDVSDVSDETVPLVASPKEWLEAGGWPARSGKRYWSEARAVRTAHFLNWSGAQRLRYEWRVARHADGTYELWTFPRPVIRGGLNDELEWRLV